MLVEECAFSAESYRTTVIFPKVLEFSTKKEFKCRNAHLQYGFLSKSAGQKNRILHRSPMQTEKSQPEGKRIMPETRVTEFPEFSVDQRVGVSRSASETDV